jgi:xanthine dehydrogenase YagR molybdenum-binding subunit
MRPETARRLPRRRQGGHHEAKGVAELGICGVAAAVANAIHHATGVRVRDYPITLDKLLTGLASAA